mgnify:CR=1 FL=1
MLAVTRSRADALLDDTSRAIIAELQQDGRRAYATIGKSVGLSEAAVRSRVQRLTESGILQVVGVTDPLQLGFARQAMLGIRVAGDVEPVADRLSNLEDVEYVVVTAASFGLLVEVVCREDDHLHEVVNREFLEMPDVLSAEILLYLNQAKQNYACGV